MIILIFATILLVGLTMAANWVTARNQPTLTLAFNRFLLLNHLGLLLFGGGILLLEWLGATAVLAEEGAAAGELASLGWTLLFMGGWGTAVTQRRIREWLYPIVQVQPNSPVHTLALIFAGYLIANSAAAFAQGGLEGIADAAVSASVWDVLLNQSLFLLLGLFGVGWLIRRDGRDLLARLGLVWPTFRQMAIGTGLIILMIILQALAGAVWLLLEPEQAELFGEMNNILLADFDSIAKWLLLALASGVGEEILFRGAIQPIFGLGFTSLLFAFAHVQYGLTPIFFLVFIMGIVLGLARQQYNTTVAIYIHCGYNFILGLAALLAA